MDGRSWIYSGSCLDDNGYTDIDLSGVASAFYGHFESIGTQLQNLEDKKEPYQDEIQQPYARGTNWADLICGRVLDFWMGKAGFGFYLDIIKPFKWRIILFPIARL